MRRVADDTEWSESISLTEQTGKRVQDNNTATSDTLTNDLNDNLKASSHQEKEL